MIPIQCAMCENYLKNNKCKAFQTIEIPFEILSGQIDHDEVLPNQDAPFIYKQRKNQKPKT